jgi:gamma-glutamylcyclotransferase
MIDDSHRPSHQGRTQSLYFAYGSNLSLEQMAARCPESRYIGLARLHDFRWQINQRGVANVVPKRGSVVEGLCYLLSRKDEVRLDKNEGVPIAYVKQHEEVELFTASGAIVGRRVKEIIDHDLVSRPQVEPAEGSSDLQPAAGFLNKFRAHPKSHKDRDERSGDWEKIEGERVTALVYISPVHILDGPPRSEYVKRMNRAIANGIVLGMSQQYVDETMRLYIKEEYGNEVGDINSARVDIGEER